MRTIEIDEGSVSIDGNRVDPSSGTFYLNTDKITAYYVYDRVDECGKNTKGSNIKIFTEHHVIDIDGYTKHGTLVANLLRSSEREERDDTDESIKVCVTNLGELTHAVDLLSN